MVCSGLHLTRDAIDFATNRGVASYRNHMYLTRNLTYFALTWRKQSGSAQCVSVRTKHNNKSNHLRGIVTTLDHYVKSRRTHTRKLVFHAVD